eukprot:1180460-Prorocentrum_minimum.AAC.2
MLNPSRRRPTSLNRQPARTNRPPARTNRPPAATHLRDAEAEGRCDDGGGAGLADAGRSAQQHRLLGGVFGGAAALRLPPRRVQVRRVPPPQPLLQLPHLYARGG